MYKFEKEVNYFVNLFIHNYFFFVYLFILFFFLFIKLFLPFFYLLQFFILLNIREQSEKFSV